MPSRLKRTLLNNSQNYVSYYRSRNDDIDYKYEETPELKYIQQTICDIFDYMVRRVPQHIIFARISCFMMEFQKYCDEFTKALKYTPKDSGAYKFENPRIRNTPQYNSLSKGLPSYYTPYDRQLNTISPEDAVKKEEYFQRIEENIIELMCELGKPGNLKTIFDKTQDLLRISGTQSDMLGKTMEDYIRDVLDDTIKDPCEVDRIMRQEMGISATEKSGVKPDSTLVLPGFLSEFLLFAYPGMDIRGLVFNQNGGYDYKIPEYKTPTDINLSESHVGWSFDSWRFTPTATLTDVSGNKISSYYSS